MTDTSTSTQSSSSRPSVELDQQEIKLPSAKGNPDSKRPRLRKVMLFVGVPLAILIAVSALLMPVRHHDHSSHTYSVPSGRLVVSDDQGSVTFVPSSGRQVRVTRNFSWGLGGRHVSERVVNGELRINARLTNQWGVSLSGPAHLDYQIAVPATFAVTVHTRTGAINLSGLQGRLTLSSDTGRIRATVATDYLHAHTATGSISLTFTRSPHIVNATSDIGAITVQVPEDAVSYRVRASSHTATSVKVRTDPNGSDSITAHSSIGHVTIKALP